MNGIRGIGMTIAAGSMLLLLAACSRTTDGTIVSAVPMEIPGVSLAPKAPPFVPSWMKRKPSETQVAANFPPPPEMEAGPRRRQARPPVVKSGSGNLACENRTEGGRVRMVCK